MRTRTAVHCLVAMLALVGRASASPQFPAVIGSELGITIGDPNNWCTLCHSTKKGGKNTITTPFGRSMIAGGVLAGTSQTLRIAIKAAQAAGTDSDLDGISDTDELQAGTDPNVPEVRVGEDGGVIEPGPLPSQPPIMLTGCALARVSSEPSGLGPWTIVLGLVVIGRARRR